MEQPREPRFYPNEVVLPIHSNRDVEKTLQSIDGTLKRIESTLLEVKTLFSALGDQAFFQQK